PGGRRRSENDPGGAGSGVPAGGSDHRRRRAAENGGRPKAIVPLAGPRSKTSRMNQPAPVAILRSGPPRGRALRRRPGRMGVPVYGVDGARWEPALSSRYCRGRLKLDIEQGPAQESLRRLLQLGERLGRPVLVPATDVGAVWVADHASVLQPAFRFP